MSHVVFRKGKRTILSRPLEEIERMVDDIQEWYVTADNRLTTSPRDADVTIGVARSLGGDILVEVDEDVTEDEVSLIRYLAETVAPRARFVADQAYYSRNDVHARRVLPYGIRYMAQTAQVWAQFLRYEHAHVDPRSRQLLEEARVALLDAAARIEAVLKQPHMDAHT
jgi:hypothetical protein